MGQPRAFRDVSLVATEQVAGRGQFSLIIACPVPEPEYFRIFTYKVEAQIEFGPGFVFTGELKPLPESIYGLTDLLLNETYVLMMPGFDNSININY